MKLRNSRFLAVILAFVMCMGTVPVYAASIGSNHTDTNVGTDATQGASTSYGEYEAPLGVEANVYMTVDGDGLVAGVPTSIVLNGSYDNNGKNIGRYGISVIGDMAGDDVLYVRPVTDTFMLHQSGKSDVSANISQDKEMFTASDLTDGSAVTQGIIDADALSAGSWRGSVNFEISSAVMNIYYSTLEGAIVDANNLTTENADVNRNNINDAVAALQIVDGKAYIRVMKDTVCGSVTAFENVSMNLDGHTVSFDGGTGITYQNDFSMYNGTINAKGAASILTSDADNKDSSFVLSDVTVNYSAVNTITSNVVMFRVYSHDIKVNNVIFNCTGAGNESYTVTPFENFNGDADSVIMEDITINSDITNTKRFRGMYVAGNAVILSPTVCVTNTDSATQGITVTPTSPNVVIDNAAVRVEADTTDNVYGIICYGMNTTIKNSNIYVDDTIALTGAGIAASVSKVNQLTLIENCTIYGKEWAFTTSAVGKTEIRNVSSSSTDHSCYIGGNTDIYDSEFYIANCKNQTKIDKPFGFYIGSSDGPDDFVVNLTRCNINNGGENTADDDKEFADATVSAKTNNNYIAPSEVNFYDCNLYRTRHMSTGDPGKLFSFNYTFKNWYGRTKFNLYGDTKIMDDNGTLWTKDKFDELNSTWRTTNSYHQSTGLYDEASIGNALIGGFVGNVDVNTGVINEIYLTDDAGVYDYR